MATRSTTTVATTTARRRSETFPRAPHCGSRNADFGLRQLALTFRIPQSAFRKVLGEWKAELVAKLWGGLLLVSHVHCVRTV